tara:strand:- start:429 stop:2612 length:2184 start_codon:yes stop_codon:yes gene_type:complete
MVNSGKRCSSEKIVKDMQNLFEQNLESDPLIPVISREDKNKINIAVKNCDFEYNKCNGDAKCQNIAKSNLMKRLPWKENNIYPWRNYDYNYFNAVQKNYNLNSSKMKNSAFTLNDVLDNSTSIETVVDGYLIDSIPSDSASAGSSNNISDPKNYDYGYKYNPSSNTFDTDSYQCECGYIDNCIKIEKETNPSRQCDNKCIRGCFNEENKNKCIIENGGNNKFVRCGAQNTMANRASDINIKPNNDPFFNTNKLKGKYSSSYYTKIGGCPRNDINNEKKCKDNRLKWSNNKLKKLFSEIAGCKDHCSCQAKKYPNNYCSSILQQSDCKGSCTWNKVDKSNQYCQEKPPECKDWNRVDCEGGVNFGGGKCKWDEATAKCMNKYVGIDTSSKENSDDKNLSKVLQSCINNDEESTCVSPCEWSSEKKICSIPILKCSDIKEKNKCSGTCIWNDTEANCKEKSLICSDRTRDSCSGTCEWKFFQEPPKTNNNGSCSSDRFMFIDNSPKSFVDGSKGKGLIQSVGSDMLSITPDKIYYAATGKSVPGNFEHQQCVNVSEFNMDGTMRGFTSSMFNFKARQIYLQELEKILKKYINGDFSLAIDLVQNVTNDSILFTVLIYKIYDNNDNVLDDLKRFSENFVSQEQVTFLRDLSQNLIQKKVYFNRKVFREQMIIFNNIKCKTNCPVETFSNYKENSKSNYNNSISSIKINRIVCILLFLILIIFIKYLYIRI